MDVQLTNQERQLVLEKLIYASEQCHFNFEGKSILATEKDDCVQSLLQVLEDIFEYGLKKSSFSNVMSTIPEQLRFVTQKIIPDQKTSSWSFIRNFILSHDLQNFDDMEYITTDIGKTRTWLRTCLNEQSLDRYMKVIFQNRTLLLLHYEPSGLFLDGECANTLLNIIQGLKTILFAINIKDEDLNKVSKVTQQYVKTEGESVEQKAVTASFPIPVLRKDLSVVTKTDAKKKKKKKVQVATIDDLDDIVSPNKSQSISISFEKNMLIYNGMKERSLSSPSTEKQIFSGFPPFDSKSNSIPSHGNDTSNLPSSGNMSSNIPSSGKMRSNIPSSGDMSSTIPSSGNMSSNIPSTDNNSSFAIAQEENDNVNENKSAHDLKHISAETIPVIDDINLKHSFISNSDNNLVNKQVDNETTPGKIEQIPDPTVDSIIENYRTSSNTEKILSYDEEASLAASNAIALLTVNNHTEELLQENILAEKISKNVSLAADKKITEGLDNEVIENLSTIDLKQAILAIARKKDEVDYQNKVLRTALDEQRDLNSSLMNEIHMLKKQSEEVEIVHKKKSQELTMEINLLKNHLEKYVTAVKLLNDDNNTSNEKTSNVQPSDVTHDDTKTADVQNDIEKDNLFEQKLAQMAEMHGELLEFQRCLQEQLIARDHEISRITNQLVQLRGPLPQSPCSVSKYGGSSSDISQSALISIWLPSVFLKGKGTDVYHLYQVYIRIGEDEWNVYRRYSQFNKLHTQIQKIYPCMTNYEFPKKKLFGKKESKFVQDRRLKLQKYLRYLINICLRENNDLAQSPSKNTLTNLLPFFGHGYDEEDSKIKQATVDDTSNSLKYSGL